MKEWAIQGYRKTTPVPFYLAPNSLVGTMLGRVYSIPSKIKALYLLLKSKHNMSDLAIIGMGLAIPVTLGLCFICLLDHFYQAQARREGHQGAHLHAE